MIRLNVGENVIIRYGREQGLKAIIIKSLPSDGYKVKVENGFICYYSGKGLARATEETKLVGS